MAKRRTKRGLSRATMLAMQLGPQSAQVKLASTPGQWKRLKKTAHARGLSMEEFFTRTPKALATKNTKQLQNQATKTVSSAYAPAHAELNTRESQIKAVDDKRKRDDAYYRDWLAQQTATLSTDVNTANQMLGEKLTGMDEAARAAYAQAAQVAAANVAGTAGVVSSPGNIAGANAIKALPVRAAEADITRTGETRRSLEASDLSGSMRAATAANTLAAFAADEARRTSETWKALSDISGERTSLKLKQAADVNQEVARLLDQEITKASSNRDFNVLLDKLDLQGQELKVKARGQKLTARQKTLDRREKSRHNRAMEQADRDRIAFDEDKNASTRADKRAEFIAKYGKTPEQWRKMNDSQRLAWQKKWSKAKDNNKNQNDKNQLTANQRQENAEKASQFVSSVNTLKRLLRVKDGGVSNRRSLINKGYSNDMINMAFDLKVHRKLSPPNRRAALRVLKPYGQKKLPREWGG